MSAATQTPTAHIRLDAQGRAWIDDTNVKVIEVVHDAVGWSMTPQQIHEEYARLSLAQVHAALSYYYDHKAQFDAEIAAELREYDAAHAQQGETPTLRKARALGLRP